MWMASNFFDTMGIALVPPTMVLHMYMLRKIYSSRQEEEQRQDSAESAAKLATEGTRLLT